MNQFHEVSLTVNGAPARLRVVSRTTLAEALRDQPGLTGTKLGCEQGACGACTVMYDGEQVRACLLFAVQAEDAEVWTVEGLVAQEADGTDAPVSGVAELAEAFRAHHAVQCGFCTPGMLIAGACIGRERRELDEATIRAELSGNICRCTGYQGIVRAIAETFAEPGDDGRSQPCSGSPGAAEEAR